MLKDKGDHLILRIVLTLGALSAAFLHMYEPAFIPDAISAGLILFALLPWLAPLIKSVEVTGLGKLELQVHEVEQSQAALREDVDTLRFLVSGFVTDWEYNHLIGLRHTKPFEYEHGGTRDDRFLLELVRLRDFGLIRKKFDYSIFNFPKSGNLKDFFELTERGVTYLRLREQFVS